MNRVVTIIDDDPELGIGLAQFCGCGLGTEIYTTTQLVGDKKRNIPGMSQEKLDGLFSGLGIGDRALLVGPGAFPILQKWHHFGIRGENYFDCSRLKRLGTSTGAFVKCVHQDDLPLGNDVIEYFLSPEFIAIREFPELNYRNISTLTDAIPFLDYLMALPIDVPYGFDYEGSGLAFVPDFKITGAAFALPDWTAVFFSFTDIRRNSVGEEWDKFLSLFKDILVKHGSNCWVYNASYEAQVTWRTFGIEVDFKDASVYNVMDGLHSKNYSLKWSVQRILGGGTEYSAYLKETDSGGILPWDTEFDYLENTLRDMFYIQSPTRGKKVEEIRRPDVFPGHYKHTEEWGYICKRYPEYVPEFERLIDENFGNQFSCQPSGILSKYCCLDSMYTLMIHQERKGRYSDLCEETYLSNISLGQKLTRAGLYIDDSFRERYDKYCDKMMLRGITHAALYRTKVLMEEHRRKAANINKYNSVCQTLLRKEQFFGGNALEITKSILSSNLDEMECYDTGLDEGSLLMKYGETFANYLLSVVRDTMKEIKFKGKIDEGIVRKKKLLGIVSEKIGSYLGLDTMNLGRKHEELEKFLFTEKGYKFLLAVAEKVKDPNDIPETLMINGTQWTAESLGREIMKTYYPCSSPIEDDIMTTELYNRFQSETIYLATILRESNKLDGEKDFYRKREITDPQTGYDHWMKEYQRWYEMRVGNTPYPEGYVPEYPEDVWWTAQSYQGMKKKEIKEKVYDIWRSWNGLDSMDKFFGIFEKNLDLLRLPYTDDILEMGAFEQMQFFMVNVLLYKKYSKIKKTYLNGLFYDNSRYVIESEKLMPYRDATQGEIDAGVATKKCFVRAEILKKETKRWSSGYHTIPSHMDVKSCVTCPVITNPETGKRTATFMSYFDISSAEVRTLGYKSGDTNLINLFETGQDVYIHTAIAHLGKEKWDSLSKGDQKAQRKIFKVVFLAVAYRMSARTLGENLNVDERDAQALIDTLFGEFPTLKGYIEEKTKMPERSGDGLVETLLGDCLQVTDWRFRYKVDDYGRKVIDHWRLAKCERAGINYCIQNYSAVSLAAGFNNVQRTALRDNFVCRNVIVVHDSCENYVDINKIFDIFPYYMQNFMEYSYSLYGIRFLFDLDVGVSYGDMATLHQVDENTITLTGKATVLREFLRKIMYESDLKVECDTRYEDLVPKMVDDSIQRFLKDHQCCMTLDESKYTITLFRK